MYYIENSTYIGPNPDQVDLRQRDYYVISADPLRTNSSHEILIEGWLGSNGDWSSYACGEYPSEEAAIEYLKSLGCRLVKIEAEFGEIEEFWTAEECDEEWDANDWFQVPDAEFGITAQSSDDDLEKLAAKEEAAAKEDGKALVGVIEYLTEIRDRLIEEKEN